jgi:DNA-directed RNA polymerase subunit RPC12/RpoP
MTKTPAPAWEVSHLPTEPILSASRLRCLPRVELRGDRLVWFPIVGESAGKDVDAPADLLLRFVRLADASPQHICDFAARWGVLGICKHGVPSSHNPGCRPRSNDEYDYWETLEVWRHFARHARALLNVAARLHDEKLGEAADWRVVYEQSGQVAPWWNRSHGSLGVERLALADCVNEWLLIGNVRPALTWSPGEGCSSKVGLAGSGLFGVLAIRILMAVSRTAGLALCSWCGEPYAPKRRPRADRRNYCPKCGIKAAWRDAQRERRQLKAKKKEHRVKASLSR